MSCPPLVSISKEISHPASGLCLCGRGIADVVNWNIWDHLEHNLHRLLLETKLPANISQVGLISTLIYIFTRLDSTNASSLEKKKKVILFTQAATLACPDRYCACGKGLKIQKTQLPSLHATFMVKFKRMHIRYP